MDGKWWLTSLPLLLLLPPPLILVLFQYVPETVQSQASYFMDIDKLVYMQRQKPSQHNAEGEQIWKTDATPLRDLL